MARHQQPERRDLRPANVSHGDEQGRMPRWSWAVARLPFSRLVFRSVERPVPLTILGDVLESRPLGDEPQFDPACLVPAMFRYRQSGFVPPQLPTLIGRFLQRCGIIPSLRLLQVAVEEVHVIRTPPRLRPAIIRLRHLTIENHPRHAALTRVVPLPTRQEGCVPAPRFSAHSPLPLRGDYRSPADCPQAQSHFRVATGSSLAVDYLPTVGPAQSEIPRSVLLGPQNHETASRECSAMGNCLAVAVS